MRVSRAFLPTLKEAPAEAEVVSHRLMVRAAVIRKLAAGIYSVLPLGLRVQRKVENIVREEMDRHGAQEVSLPVLSPAELWMESGRWQVYGKELMRLKDRHERQFCLGPTHEEVITDLVRREVRSYRDLPLNLYQIQTKFRDEVRPRFGVMRGREFLMKDAYSFDRDEAGAEESYRQMFDAYSAIFRRCGLGFAAVEADPGAIGGSFSHEFMVLADTGEEAITVCGKCGYAANVEKTPVCESGGGDALDGQRLERVHTPGARTIEEVSAFLGVPPARLAKTLIYFVDGGATAVLVPGDRALNEVKLKNFLGANELTLADGPAVERLTGAEVGFAGPVGLSLPLVADHSLRGRGGLVVGANETDYHYAGAEEGKDFKVERFADLSLAREGDPCPRCREPLGVRRGIEVGHVFKLGEKYSRALGATYLDEKGEGRLIVMGCYGIGIGRTVAAAIEQNHDAEGIIWPAPIAPYHAYLIPINQADAPTREAAESLYRELTALGVETLYDDRDGRAGVKFKDADLLGVPYKVVVGPKGLREGKVEVQERRRGPEGAERVAREAVARTVRDRVEEAIRRTERGGAEGAA
ncbi:MAG: proline--tRNA ligase [Nitrospinota bacterium]